MATGGYDPTTENETPWEDHEIDHNDTDDEEEKEKYKTPLTSPMKPPPPPENFEMSYLPRERQNKWEPSSSQKEAWFDVKNMFPEASKAALEVDYVKIPGVKDPRLSIKIRGAMRAYWLFERNLFGRWRENPDLPQDIKVFLGKSINEQIKDLKKQQSEKESTLAVKQKQMKQLEQKNDEKQKLIRDTDFIINEIRDVDEQMREMEYVHVSMDLEEIQKLKDKKRALEGEKKTKQQQISQLQKDMIQYNTIQEEVAKLTHENREIDQHLNELRAKEETLKPLDELEQEAEEINRKIKEDRQLIDDDENTSPSERAAAEARVVENEAELDRINTEIEVRERERPLLERIKDIFKKYGWTLQAIFVAVGVILSVIALAVKKGTKVISQKLNNVKQEPGFIGSIVSFIFKAASQVFAFLSEHTWLIILVVVAFFMERLLKKRRK